VTFGMPLVFVLSIQSAVTITDRIMLDYLVGGDLTGLYSAAQDVPWRLINMLIVAIHIAAYQLAVNKLDHEGEEACKAQLRQNFTLLLGLGLPATIGIIMLSPGLAQLFLGEKFRPFFVEYVMFFAPLAFMNSFLQHYFILSFNFLKKNHMMIIPFSIALAIKILVGYVGIQYAGVHGAIMASFLAYAFLIVAAIVLARPVFRMPVPFLPTLQIVISCAIMACAIYVFNYGDDLLSLVFAVLVAVIVYSASIYLMNTGNIRVEINKIISTKTHLKAL
jgi:O-antigen/teichoic acid export membrane protein